MPSYVFTGRGGAGNIARLPTSTSTKPSSSSEKFIADATPRIVSSGVGGAGNMRAVDSATRSSAAKALHDDIHRAAARDRHPVGYAGRGGAGNAYAYAGGKGNISGSDDDASLLSGTSVASSVASSVGERARGWASRVSGSFSRS